MPDMQVNSFSDDEDDVNNITSLKLVHLAPSPFIRSCLLADVLESNLSINAAVHNADLLLAAEVHNADSDLSVNLKDVAVATDLPFPSQTFNETVPNLDRMNLPSVGLELPVSDVDSAAIVSTSQVLAKEVLLFALMRGISGFSDVDSTFFSGLTLSKPNKITTDGDASSLSHPVVTIDAESNSGPNLLKVNSAL